MLKIITISFLLLVLNSVWLINNCYALFYRDKENGITFVLHDLWFHNKKSRRLFEKEHYEFYFQPGVSVFVKGNSYSTVFFKSGRDYIYDEKLPEALSKNFQNKIKSNNADFGLFTLTEAKKNTLSVYVKVAKNKEKDFCVLEEADLEAIVREYMEDLRQEGFENVIYVDSGGVQNRNMTIEVAGYRTKDNNAAVKRIVSRYGKIVVLTGYFIIPRQKIDLFEEYLEGVEDYFDHITYCIDFDNCVIVNEEEERLRFKEI